MNDKLKTPLFIAIDFDNTCTSSSWDIDSYGTDLGAVPVLRRLVEAGHKLVLFTCRSDGETDQILPDGTQYYAGDWLTHAKKWFSLNQIPLHSVTFCKDQHTYSTSFKPAADLFIDDKALGCPLRELNGRNVVDWSGVETLLQTRNII